MIPATLPVRTFEQLLTRVGSEAQVLAFFSMLDVGRPLHRELMARLRAEHPEAMLGAAIPVAEEVERMGVERTVVSEFAPGSRAALAYEALWWDVRARLRTAV